GDQEALPTHILHALLVGFGILWFGHCQSGNEGPVKSNSSTFSESRWRCFRSCSSDWGRRWCSRASCVLGLEDGLGLAAARAGILPWVARGGGSGGCASGSGSGVSARGATVEAAAAAAWAGGVEESGGQLVARAKGKPACHASQGYLAPRHVQEDGSGYSCGEPIAVRRDGDVRGGGSRMRARRCAWGVRSLAVAPGRGGLQSLHAGDLDGRARRCRVGPRVGDIDRWHRQHFCTAEIGRAHV